MDGAVQGSAIRSSLGSREDRLPQRPGNDNVLTTSPPSNRAQAAQCTVDGIRCSAALNAPRDAGCPPRPCSSRVTASPQQAPSAGPGSPAGVPVSASGVISRQSMYRLPPSTMPHRNYRPEVSQILRSWPDSSLSPLNAPAGTSQACARHVSALPISFTAHPTPSA